ncbi:hypothetical protein O7627_36620 [Solwaraspora sp. WMMD1047]|uniref:hypothetical protein n=1 Tax=Solwaraspora sp. WMMD1047 TaxID=3016102 RepID=UPI002417A58B|nr:hypothetical protein [Solwaraspora sp. WMMD1047]MDG4834794.1 hypothetical protein [Solwaraspora sp. WMMD1047]
MPGGPGHLCIDLAASAITATLGHGQHRTPLLIDCHPLMPAGVYADPDTGHLHTGPAAHAAAVNRPDRYLTHPFTHPTDSVDPAGAAAAVLTHIAAQAHAAGAPITALTLSIPPSWGPRRRDHLHTAATQAGLPPPALVTAPAAIAAHVTTHRTQPPPHGAYMLICHATTHPITLTVLQTTPNGYHELATTSVNPDIDPDTLLLHHLTNTHLDDDPDLRHRLTHPNTLEDQRLRWTLTQSLHQARHTLTTHDRTAVLLPEPHPPAVLTQHDLATATKPVLDQIPAAVSHLLDATDIDPTHLYDVIVHHDPTLPAVTDHLQQATARPATVVHDPHATTDGALHLTNNPTAGGTPLPRVRLRPSHLTAAAVTGACSLALLIQTITTADTYQPYGTILAAYTSVHQLAAAGILAMLTALTIAHLAPTTWLTHPPPTGYENTTGTLIRRAYLTAALTGTTTAALYGLATGTAFGLDLNRYLNWSLLPALPLTLCALTIAITAPRIPTTDLPQWLRRIRPHALPVAIATTGILLMRSAVTLTPPADLTPFPITIGSIGAAAVAVATVLTVTTHTLTRTITAPLLAIGYALLFTYPTSSIFITGYLLTLTWWTVTATTRTLRTAFPKATQEIRRLLDRTSPT